MPYGILSCTSPGLLRRYLVAAQFDAKEAIVRLEVIGICRSRLSPFLPVTADLARPLPFGVAIGTSLTTTGRASRYPVWICQAGPRCLNWAAQIPCPGQVLLQSFSPKAQTLVQHLVLVVVI